MGLVTCVALIKVKVAFKSFKEGRDERTTGTRLIIGVSALFEQQALKARGSPAHNSLVLGSPRVLL